MDWGPKFNKIKGHSREVGMHLMPTDTYYTSAILRSTSSVSTSGGPYGGEFFVDFKCRLSLIDRRLATVSRSCVDGDGPVAYPNAPIIALDFR